MIYIASPYTHELEDVMQQRYDDVCIYFAHLLRAGEQAFCPIAHTHPINYVSQEHEFWMNVDRPFLEMCDTLHVLMLPGWNTSQGVADEIRHFHENNKIVVYVEPQL